MKKIVFLAISFAILAACTNEVAETPISFTKELTFTATQEGLYPESRTVRMDDGSTWWNAEEEISVFYGSGSDGGSKFTSQNSSLQEIVEFTGSIQMSGSGKDFWAVYPYSQENECDESSITTIIPAVQTGSEGNFSGDAFPTIAKSKTLDLAFWNICGGVKFFVSRSDIKSVTFKGNGGETLAGKVRVTFNAEGKPEVAEVLDGETEVTLNAPDGGTFKPGKSYYITLLPAALDGGFTMTFNTADKKGVVSSDKAQTVKRSIFGVLKNIDSKVSEWESTVVEPEWVDLGLSVKWATFNVGASKPEEYGDFYAWGETEPKDDYSWLTYKWCNGSSHTQTKYNTSSSYGTVDNKTVLDPEDDAAHVNWGGSWRMPTAEECEELINKCTWTWTTQNGVNGRLVTGPNGKSIFLPAAGNRYGADLFNAGSGGYYWSSSLNTGYPYGACYVYFDSGLVYRSSYFRYLGLSVRPVYDDRIHPESVTLNKSTLSLYVGESEQLTATVLPDNATDKTLIWSSDNAAVATVDYDGNVTAIDAGSATITVKTIDGGLTASCVVTATVPGPKAVDLGLSVKWATFNVGASKPEEYGDYFAWGETEPKDDYSWLTYKFRVSGDDWANVLFNKYCTDSYYWDSTDPMDNKTVLDPNDDAARANWGSRWRMPTDEEWTELSENCNWTLTTNYIGTGIKGLLATSKINGNSIFLPAAGSREGTDFFGTGVHGSYWSSSLYNWYIDDEANVYLYDQAFAFCVELGSTGLSGFGGGRCSGLSVRPVTKY